MEKITLKAKKREKSTKGYVNQLRRDGQIPAICYNHKNNVALELNRIEFEKAILRAGGNITIELDIEGDKTRQVLLKDYQTGALQKEIVHADFFEITKTRPLKTSVPIKLTGNPKGIKKGGVLEHVLHKLVIESLPADIPATIEINVSDLDVGDSIKVDTLDLGKKVKVITSQRQAIVSVATSRATRLAGDKGNDDQPAAAAPAAE